jgi:hypothetical protein
MSDKARLGRRILLAIIVVIALAELSLAGLNLVAGQFRGAQVARVLLTGWLLWQVWEGASWARWVLTALFSCAAVFTVVVLCIASSATPRQSEVVVLLLGSAAACLLFGLGLASPWVAAYQVAKRGHVDAEQNAAADRGNGN